MTENREILPGTIEFWAREKPDQVAIIEGDRSFTYSEWNERADRLAEGLSQIGLRAKDIVVVRTQIRIEWAIISSALAKLGCSLLGANWRLTPSEIEYVLKNSGANAIICDDPDPLPLREALANLPIRAAVSIDTHADGYEFYPYLMRNFETGRISKGDAPRIIYTSGTTGLPKGVVSNAQQRARHDPKVAEYLRDVAADRSAGKDDVVLITLPMHHAAGPSALTGAMQAGNQIILLRRFDAAEALGLIEKHQVTNWTGVPTMFKRMAGLPESTLANFDVSSLKKLGIGAAPVTADLKDWIERFFGEGLLSEGYGSTETGMITHMPQGQYKLKPGSCGRPHKNVDIQIRDDDGNEVAIGDVGEIWVRTPVMINEYLNAGPMDSDTLDADGFFRIGDVGRMDEDGYLFITDRAKDMIISGGVNLYPAEIEAALSTHPAVQDAAVIGIPNVEFGEEVKAFVELKSDGQVDAESLLAHAAQHLASYKRPKTIEIIDELPRNTMGKILKRELREPYWKDQERKV